MFTVIDWMCNPMFNGMIFKTFDDAWEYITEQIDDDEAHQDIFVVETKPYRGY